MRDRPFGWRNTKIFFHKMLRQCRESAKMQYWMVLWCLRGPVWKSTSARGECFDINVHLNHRLGEIAITRHFVQNSADEWCIAIYSIHKASVQSPSTRVRYLRWNGYAMEFDSAYISSAHDATYARCLSHQSCHFNKPRFLWEPFRMKKRMLDPSREMFCL